jgi:FtsP/CotA-like multicopper oxidase with cupredoxin domain
MEPVTETASAGTPEVWELYNFTEDAGPIHIHQAQFTVVDRQPFDGLRAPQRRGSRDTKDTLICYRARSRACERGSTSPACTCGTATSSSTRTTR